MNTEIDPNSKKDESLKNDFKIGQYVYVAVYALLVICLIVFYG